MEDLTSVKEENMVFRAVDVEFRNNGMRPFYTNE